MKNQLLALSLVILLFLAAQQTTYAEWADQFFQDMFSSEEFYEMGDEDEIMEDYYAVDESDFIPYLGDEDELEEPEEDSIPVMDGSATRI